MRAYQAWMQKHCCHAGAFADAWCPHLSIGSQVHLFVDESTAPAPALAESIAKVATECQAVLVAMARSIKSPMTRLLSGSVTEDVQHRLHCPLVLVP